MAAGAIIIAAEAGVGGEGPGEEEEGPGEEGEGEGEGSRCVIWSMSVPDFHVFIQQNNNMRSLSLRADPNPWRFATRLAQSEGRAHNTLLLLVTDFPAISKYRRLLPRAQPGIAAILLAKIA